jgi:shikimate dehydrogenase
LDPAALRPGQLVVDLVPNPAVTPLLRAADAAGARVAGGLGMLVHQGALAFELWTGRSAPLAVMRRAAIQALVGA